MRYFVLKTLTTYGIFFEFLSQVKSDENINIFKLLRKKQSLETDAGVTHPGPSSFPRSGVNFMQKLRNAEGKWLHIQ